MNKRTKATDIPQTVKKKVWERDGHRCIVCGNPEAMPHGHFVRRSKGGLGIEQNIVTLCTRCHHEFDNGKNGMHYQAIVRDYLKAHYKNWIESDLVYRK